MTAALATARRTTLGAAASYRVQAAISVHYRGNTGIWVVAGVLRALVYLTVWQAVARAGGGSVGDYDTRTLAGYFIASVVLRDLVGSGLPYHLPHHVREGKLAMYLLRPVHPVAHYVGHGLAWTTLSVAMAIPAAVVLAVVFDARIVADPAVLFAVIALIPLAIAARTMVDAIVSTSSMWLVRIDGFRGMYFALTLLVGGQFAPISLLPGWLEATARFLPFYWALGFPLELLVGRAELADVPQATAVLTAWALVAYVLFQPIWRQGTRAYEAVGQ